jgi:hypothetical protein
MNKIVYNRRLSRKLWGRYLERRNEMSKQIYSREIKMVDKEGHVIMQGESHFLRDYLINMIMARSGYIMLSEGVYSVTLGKPRIIYLEEDID